MIQEQNTNRKKQIRKKLQCAAIALVYGVSGPLLSLGELEWNEVFRKTSPFGGVLVEDQWSSVCEAGLLLPQGRLMAELIMPAD